MPLLGGAGDSGYNLSSYFSRSLSLSLEIGLLVAVRWAEKIESVSSCFSELLKLKLGIERFFSMFEPAIFFSGSFCLLKKSSKVVGSFLKVYLTRPKSPPDLLFTGAGTGTGTGAGSGEIDLFGIAELGRLLTL